MNEYGDSVSLGSAPKKKQFVVHLGRERLHVLTPFLQMGAPSNPYQCTVYIKYAFSADEFIAREPNGM
jgi:hypothetical protein